MDKKVVFQRLGVILAYPLAYAYVRLVLSFTRTFYIDAVIGEGRFSLNIAYPIFALLFIIVNEIVRRGRRNAEEKPSKETIFWYALTFLSGLTATFGPEEMLSVFAMHLCAVYSVLISNNILLGGKTSGFIPADLIHGFYVKSFAGFPNFFVDWKAFVKPKTEDTTEVSEAAPKKHILSAVIFVIIMSVLLLFAVCFMASIDNDISAFFDSIFGWLCDYLVSLNVEEIFVRLVFAIPVCLYLYGLMARSAKSDGMREKRVAAWLLQSKGKGKTVSSLLVYIAAGVFVGGYILFFIKRLAYMLGGFSGRNARITLCKGRLFRARRHHGCKHVRIPCYHPYGKIGFRRQVLSSCQDPCNSAYVREHHLRCDRDEQARSLLQHFRIYSEKDPRDVGDSHTWICGIDDYHYCSPW